LDRDDLDVVIQNAISTCASRDRNSISTFRARRACDYDLIVGYRRYTLPADLRTIITVRDETAGRRIQKEDYRIFDDMGIFTSGPLTQVRSLRKLHLSSITTRFYKPDHDSL